MERRRHGWSLGEVLLDSPIPFGLQTLGEDLTDGLADGGTGGMEGVEGTQCPGDLACRGVHGGGVGLKHKHRIEANMMLTYGQKNPR